MATRAFPAAGGAILLVASRVTSTTFVGAGRSSPSCGPRSPRRRPAAAVARRSSPASRASARRGCCRELERAARADGVARDRRRLRRAGGGRAALRADRRRAAPARARGRPGVRRALRAPPAPRSAQILPGLGARRRRRDDEAAAPGAPVRGLLELLELLAGEEGLLLTIEDLHWADRSTRAFLVYLAPQPVPRAVLVVTTYRPDELHRRHPLRPLLAELERDARARRVELRAAHAATSWPSSSPTSSATPPDDDARRAPVRALRGQPAVRRGAAGGRASTAAARCRRRCATR